MVSQRIPVLIYVRLTSSHPQRMRGPQRVLFDPTNTRGRQSIPHINAGPSRFVPAEPSCQSHIIRSAGRSCFGHPPPLWDSPRSLGLSSRPNTERLSVFVDLIPHSLHSYRSLSMRQNSLRQTWAGHPGAPFCTYGPGRGLRKWAAMNEGMSCRIDSSRSVCSRPEAKTSPLCLQRPGRTRMET